MDLDNIKDQLKQRIANDHYSRSPEQLAALLNRRAGSMVGKLKNSLRFEIAGCVIVIACFVWIAAVTGHRSYRIYFSVFAVVMAVLLVALAVLLNRTTRLSNTDLPVRHNLQLIAGHMKKLVKWYFFFTMLLIPVCAAFVIVLAYYEKGSFPTHLLGWQQVSPAGVIVFLGVYLLVLTIAAYYFTKWYLKKLYGNYISRLEDCINELSEE